MVTALRQQCAIFSYDAGMRPDAADTERDLLALAKCFVVVY